MRSTVSLGACAVVAALLLAGCSSPLQPDRPERQGPRQGAGDEGDGTPDGAVAGGGGPASGGPAGAQGGTATAPTAWGDPQDAWPEGTGASGPDDASGDGGAGGGGAAGGGDDGGAHADEGPCGDEAFTAGSGVPHAGAAAEAAALAVAQAFLDGDAHTFARLLEPGFVDVPAGDTGPRPMACRIEDLGILMAEGEGFGEGLRSADVLDAASPVVLMRGEYWDAANRTVLGSPVPFTPQPGDVLVLLEGRNVEPVPFGWYGIYRPAPDGWRLAAIPF